MLTAVWQDVASWLAVAVAAAYLVHHFRKPHGTGPGQCGGCTHCPMSNALQN
ncbi:MAG: hypothetical protein ACUVQG_00930 [Thermogutta sp.]